MRHSSKVALAGFTLATLLGVAFVQGRAYDLYFGHLEFNKWLVAATGWCLATYGPVSAAIFLWRLARHSRLSWLLHLSLLPSLYVLLVLGNKLMLSTLDVPDFDSTLGAPIMSALFVILATVATYCISLAVQGGAKLHSQLNGS